MPARRPVGGSAFPATAETSKQRLVLSSSHSSSISIPPPSPLAGALSLGGHRIHFVFDHPQIPRPTTYLLLYILPGPEEESGAFYYPRSLPLPVMCSKRQ